jgi:hypothetical protein
MAICNATGVIAIYNPEHKIMLSPAADGPLQFHREMLGELNRECVKQVSHYGRSFSIVEIPYSMKLLVQEMQAANVQMRILTEDSLTQLENMQSVADNIANLTHLVQPIVAKNYHDLLEFSEKGQQRGTLPAKPQYEEFALKLPTASASIGQTEGEEGPKTPDYPPPPDSPGPMTPDYPPPPSLPRPMTPDYPPPPESPGPMTPNYPPPPSSPEQATLKKGVSFQMPAFSKYYEPVTEPPKQEGGSHKLKVGNSMWSVGEWVYLRGEKKANRIWTIEKIGDHYVTIVTKDTEGLTAGEDIRIVNPSEIYDINEVDRIQTPLHNAAHDDLYSSYINPPSSPMTYSPVASPPVNNIDIRIVQGDDKSTNLGREKQGENIEISNGNGNGNGNAKVEKKGGSTVTQPETNGGFIINKLN